MRPVDPLKVAETAMNQIRKGAFLTVRAGEALNTMTIGWAAIGFVWSKPIMMIAVRTSRHTFSLIEKAADFTVSVPSSDMKEEIAFCGTRSGRDFDKFRECNLDLLEGSKVVSPVIRTPGLHFECRIVYRSAMDSTNLDHEYDTRIYPDKDYHTLYFGEIVACHEMD